MADLVSLEKVGKVGVITVDNPPVNALSPGVPEGIVDCVSAANADDDVEAMVLIGAGRGFTPDREEVALVMDLLERGYEDRVLIGNEVGWKTCYKSLGGWGYGHVLDNIVPWLHACGATREQTDKILIDNPRRLHAID